MTSLSRSDDIRLVGFDFKQELDKGSSRLDKLNSSVRHQQQRRNDHGPRRTSSSSPPPPSSPGCCDRGKCARCFKAFVAFLFSRIGLLIVMIGYIVMGGCLFQTLELQNEVNVKRDMKLILDTTIQLLWKEILRKQESSTSDVNFTRSATRILTEYEERLIRNIKSGYNGLDDSDDVEWSFFGAVLYATTLISTIGYGHVTCKTVAGKTLTVIYCIIGIPLMMLFSANIGSSMAASFRFLLRRSVSSLKRKTVSKEEDVGRGDSARIKASKSGISRQLSDETKQQMEIDALRRIDELIMRQTFNNPTLDCSQPTQQQQQRISPGAADDQLVKHRFTVWVSENDLKPCKVTNESLGDDATVAATTFASSDARAIKAFETRLDNLIGQWGFYNNRGVVTLPTDTTTYSFQRLGEANLSTGPADLRKIVRFAPDLPHPRRIPRPAPIDRNHDNVDDGQQRGLLSSDNFMCYGLSSSTPSVYIVASNNSRASSSTTSGDLVPLPMAIILFFSYVLLGAALFATWEEDWSFLNSFYFCFVTLTTIGFGDFVPGKTINARTSPTKFIIATCYIIFGLVLIGMCFDLVKERFRQYIKSFASRIAITKR